MVRYRYQKQMINNKAKYIFIVRLLNISLTSTSTLGPMAPVGDT